MASARITLVQGTSRDFLIDLTDDQGQAIPEELLVGAVGEFFLRVLPTDIANLLYFNTTTDLLKLAFVCSSLKLSFDSADSATLPIATDAWQLVVTLANGDRLVAIEWSPFDITLGGVTAPVAPVFTNTIKIDHNYGLSDNYRYMTAGGSPIENAQVRVYYQSDYDAGNLASPVGITMTKADGRWANSILVVPGYSYVLNFAKPNEFGPDVATIVV